MWKAIVAAGAMMLGAACGGTQCPGGQQLVTICAQCGASGGCASMGTICTSSCTAQSDCTLPYTCVSGTCQPVPCS